MTTVNEDLAMVLEILAEVMSQPERVVNTMQPVFGWQGGKRWLVKELDWCLNSRQEFNDFKSQRGLTDVQRAARWMLRMKNGFGGAADYFGRTSGATAFPARQAKRPRSTMS